MQFTSRSLDTSDLNSAMAVIEKTSDPEKGLVPAEEHPECLNTLLDGMLIARHLLRLR